MLLRILMFVGDPTTPGYPAYENATRTEGENIPKIPSLPISWANARRLLGEIVSSQEEALTLSGKHSERKIRLVNHGTCIDPIDRLILTPMQSTTISCRFTTPWLLFLGTSRERP